MGFVEIQRLVQTGTYGADPASLRGEERARFARDMVLAATEELHEILRCLEWKPWAERDRRGEDVEPRHHVEGEFGDLLAFVGNLACVWELGTDDVLSGHERKVRVNVQRHAHNAGGPA